MVVDSTCVARNRAQTYRANRRKAQLSTVGLKRPRAWRDCKPKTVLVGGLPLCTGGVDSGS